MLCIFVVFCLLFVGDGRDGVFLVCRFGILDFMFIIYKELFLVMFFVEFIVMIKWGGNFSIFMMMFMMILVFFVVS